MTDKKLTDEEIIKALECCISTTTEEACAGCPFNKQKLCDKDQWALERYALDLINRQKAEIEKMKECPKCVYEYDGEVTEYCVQGPCPNFKTVEQIKTEAYKEFAARLKSYLLLNEKGSISVISFENINDLLKEMVGEEWLNSEVEE